MLRAVLDQIALGRTVSIAPVAQIPDMLSVTISAGDRVVEESTCRDDEAAIRHIIRRLAVELGG